MYEGKKTCTKNTYVVLLLLVKKEMSTYILFHGEHFVVSANKMLDIPLAFRKAMLKYHIPKPVPEVKVPEDFDFEFNVRFSILRWGKDGTYQVFEYGNFTEEVFVYLSDAVKWCEEAMKKDEDEMRSRIKIMKARILNDVDDE